MMHKINVVLASIFTAVVMAVFPPVNCFCIDICTLFACYGRIVASCISCTVSFVLDFSAFVSLTINTKRHTRSRAGFIVNYLP